MSFIAQVTPVILTFNEEANIGRCLEHLDWANQIIVVDSFSTDRTREICAKNPRVRFVERQFESHAAQWNFAVEETGIQTPWVLALDCDYMVTGQVRAELEGLPLEGAVDGYWCAFRYAIHGRVLKSGIYPPVLALFRRSAGRYIQDGHTQRVLVEGEVGRLASPLVHDDRKPFGHWVNSQVRYAKLEAEKLRSEPGAGWKKFIRTRTPFGPLAVGLYCLVVRGGLFEGRHGWLYAAQRMAAEAMISAAYMDAGFTGSDK